MVAENTPDGPKNERFVTNVWKEIEKKIWLNNYRLEIY